MLRGHKVAITRICSDLIKADRIIDAGEMKCWQEICQKYSIDKTLPYNVTKSNEGVLSGHVESDIVFGKELESALLVPLLGSKLYRRYLEA